MKEKVIQDTMNDDRCVFCHGNVILLQTGRTCSRCGSILDVYYTHDAFQVSTQETYHQRVSKQSIGFGKQLDNLSPLGSYIDHYKTRIFFDAKNKPLSAERQKLYFRLKYTRDFRSKLDRRETYYRVVKIMKHVSCVLEILPDTRKRAMYLYNKVLREVRRGDGKVPNNVSLIGTCLFIAARESKNYAPVTVHEICNAFQASGHRVNFKMIIRDIMRFQQHLDIKRFVHDGKDYLERLTSKLHHDPVFRQKFNVKHGNKNVKEYIQELKILAIRIIDAIPKSVKSSRNPFILAGASIYGADILQSTDRGVKRVLTQKIIADATGIAEYSIRDHYCTIVKQTVQDLLENESMDRDLS